MAVGYHKTSVRIDLLARSEVRCFGATLALIGAEVERNANSASDAVERNIKRKKKKKRNRNRKPPRRGFLTLRSNFLGRNLKSNSSEALVAC